MEVAEVKMKHLKKLVLPFSKFKQDELGLLRDLVEELLDTESELETWEVEI